MPLCRCRFLELSPCVVGCFGGGSGWLLQLLSRMRPSLLSSDPTPLSLSLSPYIQPCCRWWWWLGGGLSLALRLPPRLPCQRATCDRLSHRGLSQSLWQGCALWHHRYLALRRCWPIWNPTGCSLDRLLVDCPTVSGARSDLLPRAHCSWV